jgi:glutathione S-transferase
MPSLALDGHSFSSDTQKALIALHENGTPFEFRLVGPDNPDHAKAWAGRWPLAKFPVPTDGERTIAETSIIIEYLQLAHPGPVRLVAADPMAALDARFLDRFFDAHVMDPVQLAVNAELGRLPTAAAAGLAIARERLERAHAWLDGALYGRTWATGADFTLADRAAAPALFHADWVHPVPERHAAPRAPPSRARSKRRAPSGRCFRWALRSGIEGIG